MIAVGNSAVKAFLGGMPVKIYLGDILLTGDAPEDEYTGVLPAVINTDGTALENYRIYGHSSGCGVNTKKVAVAELEQGTLRASDGIELTSNSRVRTKWGEMYPAGTYTVNCYGIPKVVVIYVYDENKQFVKSESLTSWANIPRSVTITQPRYIRFVVAKQSAQTGYININDVTTLEVTTPDPDYNIPIITRSINRFDANIEQGTFIPSGGSEQSSNYRVRATVGELLPAGTYTVNCAGASGCVVYVYDSSYSFKSAESVVEWTELPVTFTITEPCFVRPAFAVNADGDNTPITPSDVSDVIIAKSAEYAGIYAPYRHIETLVEIGSTPLDSGEYVSLSEQKIYRYSGGVLTPEDPPASLPDIPAFTDCKTVLDYEEAPAPASVYFKFDPA